MPDFHGFEILLTPRNTVMGGNMSGVRILCEFSLRWWGPPGLGAAATSWIVFAGAEVQPLRITLFLLFGLTGVLAMFFLPRHRIWLENGRLCWESRGWRDTVREDVRVSDIARLVRQSDESGCGAGGCVILETYEGAQFQVPQGLFMSLGEASRADDLLVALRTLNPRILQVARKSHTGAQSVEIAA